MAKQFPWHGVLFLSCVLATGCGATATPEVAKEAAPPAAQLGDRIDLSLADLLQKPRAELAELAADLTDRAKRQAQGRHEGKLRFTLLPDAGLPLVVPVWQEAKFSAEAGFCLPPYLAEGAKDNALALHLARYGDAEAARKLAEPGDAAVSGRLEALAPGRNYPAEWARVVGLLLHAAEVRLATGEVEGATELVALHKQLRDVLDPKAAQGFLGAALLPRGRASLARAADAWRSSGKTDLADQVDAALAAWGELPAPGLPYPLGAERTQLAGVLKARGKERALAADSAARVLDLLALPFPREGLEAVFACFDEAGKLSDLALTYRPRFADHFPAPANLALLLEDQGAPAEDGAKAAGLRRRSYQLPGMRCEVAVILHGAGAGAFVHYGKDKKAQAGPALARDFGAVDLDRTFEQNRVQLAPEMRGDVLTTKKPAVLDRLANPVPALKLLQAAAEREPGQDLTAKLLLTYVASPDGVPPWQQFLLPRLARDGMPRLEEGEDGGSLALVWEDGRTIDRLLLPYESGRSVGFVAQDQRGKLALAERQTTATAEDDAERKARLEAGKPLTRVPRFLEQIELGMTRKQVLQLLPAGQGALKRDSADGLSVTFATEPPKTALWAPRQLLIRFDQARKAIEIQADYAAGPAAKTTASWTGAILQGLKKRAGAPAESPDAWSAVWADLPPRKPAPICYCWQDDVSRLTCQSDGDCLTLRLRDLGAGPKAEASLAPLEYLPRGVEACQLGTLRDDLLRKWGVSEPVATADGAVVLSPPKGGPYDALLVWFDKDQAVRLVARHAKTNGSNPAGLAQALREAWAREIRTLGWPKRQDFTQHGQLESLAWHDDRTRVRLFWQEGETNLPRFYTEWRELGGR